MPPHDITESSSTGNGSVAVVVLGHGSRAPGALGLLEKVSAGLAGKLGLTVRAASLQFNRPTLEECCKELAAGGAGRIVVAPYFLFAGNHTQEDIPGALERIRKEFPGIEFILAEPLGDDGRLVDILSERIGGVLAAATVHAEPEKARTVASPKAPANTTPGLQYSAQDGSGALPQHPIEKQSFEIIDGLLKPEDPEDPEYQVIRRVIHTTGDIALADWITASPGAVAAGVGALDAGAAIVCDVNMVAAGVAPTAGLLGTPVECSMAAAETAALAKREGITRGAAAMRLKAEAGGLDGAVVAIGNAPTALFEVLRLVSERGVQPALVVGVPVGFVGATESKEALATSGIPHITLPGSCGGSAVAVAITNALLRLVAAGAGVTKGQTGSDRVSPAEVRP